MIFIVLGSGKSRPVSYACDTAAGALMRARWLAERGVRDLRIDADGHKFTPADFKRRFLQPDLVKASSSGHRLDTEVQQEDARWVA